MDEIVMEFLTEAEEGLSSIDNSLLELEKDPNNAEVIGAIFRVMHSLKGTSGFLGLSKLEKVAHAGENVLNKIRDNTLTPTPEVLDAVFRCLDTIRAIITNIREKNEEPAEAFTDLITLLDAIYKGEAAPKVAAMAEPANDHDPVLEVNNTVALEQAEPQAQATVQEPAEKKAKPQDSASDAIRVKLSLLDKLMESVGELVLARNQLIQNARQGKPGDITYRTSIQRINHITSELQESIIKTRMQPVANIWSAYPRMIRDLSKELGKQIRLDMIGENTEIDRHLVEAIKDPLTHMIRNSVDHGIEMPEDRAAAGKPREGIVTLNAYNQAGQVVIVVADDGKGLSAERIRKKCVEKGILSESQSLSIPEQQLFQYIFAPGFSTAEKVTAVSGRGVGMDVVKTNIAKIGGHIELQSKEGIGSQFIIKIPLTLAIMPVILMSIGASKYAFPLVNVYELIRINADSEYKIEYLNDSPILRIRGQIIPLILMDEMLTADSISQEEMQSKKLFVVVCNVADQTYGIVVDKIHDIEEIVVKPHSAALKSIPLYGGCTILGDGSVIMIFDPQTLLTSVKKTGDISLQKYGSSEEAIEAAKNDARTSKLLLFRGSENPEDIKAIPMEFVNRIEELETSKFEIVSDECLIQYRDTLMRLLPFNESHKYLENELAEVIVFSNNGENFGLIVPEVLDIVEHVFDNKILKSGNPKFLSTIVVNDRTTEVLDVSYIFKTSPLSSVPAEEKFQHKAHTSSSGGHILLVDDSAFFRKFIPPVISSAGYTVSVVDSVEKAKEVLLSNADITAIITDLQMPGLTGSDLADFVRSEDKFKDLPIIALSAFNVEEAESKGERLDCFDAFVPKTHQGKLIETLNRLVA